MYTKFLTLFLTTVLVLAFVMWRVTDRDVHHYQKLLKSSSGPNEEEVNYAEHMREGVCKEVWYQQEDSLLYCQIASDDSELIFFNRNGVIEVIEELETVQCVMQEKLYETPEGVPMQLIRYLEAEKAHYNYATHLLEAHDAQIWRYRLEGHTPITSFEGREALVESTAERVECTFEGKELVLHAHQMHADFIERGATVESNEATYHGDVITLFGDVRMEKKEEEQYALADVVTYFMEEQRMLLEGERNRVLFFDKAHDMRLSAPKVSIETDKETVQGKGDVRFTFGQEELLRLKERFQWVPS